MCPQRKRKLGKKGNYFAAKKNGNASEATLKVNSDQRSRPIWPNGIWKVRVGQKIKVGQTIRLGLITIVWEKNISWANTDWTNNKIWLNISQTKNIS